MKIVAFLLNQENPPSSKADLYSLLGASTSHCQWSLPYSSSRVPRLVARAQVHLDGDVRRMTKTFPMAMAMAMAIMKQRKKRKFSQVSKQSVTNIFEYSNIRIYWSRIYIRTFVRINFSFTNIFGHSFVSNLFVRIYSDIRW